MGSESSGGGGGSGGGWGRKDQPHESLCNNDSDVNDGSATSINSGLLQEPSAPPSTGRLHLKSSVLGHVKILTEESGNNGPRVEESDLDRSVQI